MFSNSNCASVPLVANIDGNGNNGGWADGGWLWIIVVFALLFGWGNGGFGGFGGNNGGGYVATAATQADIQRGFDNSAVISKLDGISNGLCDGFYAGYKNVGLYSYENCVNNYVDISRVKEAGYAIWVAKYSDAEPRIAVDYDMWQFGGSVNYLRDAQINGQTVDQNYCYTDYCTDHIVEEITVPDYEPVPDTKYHKGDTVKVINAIQYDNSEPFSTYYDEYSVLSANGRRVVIGVDGVTTAAIDEDNISLVKCIYDNDNDINTDTVNRGDGKKVRVLDNIDYDGVRFATYYDEYDVIEESGDRIVIGIGTTITAAVNIANLEFVGGASSDDAPTDIPFSEDIEEGSTVRFVGDTDYDGTPIKAWYDEYTVSERSGDRVVLVHDGELFAAVNVTDCELV